MSNFLLNDIGAIQQAQQNTNVLIVEAILAVVLVVSMWLIFKKAGEPGWIAVIPVYNLYKLFKISTGIGWTFILLFLPILRYVGLAVLGINLAKAFGKGPGFALGILLLPVVFLPILAFSDAEYIGPRGWAIYKEFMQAARNADAYSRNSYNNVDRSNEEPGDEFDGFNESEAQTVDFEVESNDRD